jgi:hypothetical protein
METKYKGLKAAVDKFNKAAKKVQKKLKKLYK